VLDGDELVALLPRLDERHVQTDFEFLGNHPVVTLAFRLPRPQTIFVPLRLLHHAL
jgi:hypothetical protein